jgi:hypothetical protein
MLNTREVLLLAKFIKSELKSTNHDFKNGLYRRRIKIIYKKGLAKLL